MGVFTRVHDRATLDEVRKAHNRHVDRDSGATGGGQKVTWTDYNGTDVDPYTGQTASTGNFTLTVDQSAGNHANFGLVFLVQDSAVTSQTTTKILGGNTLEFWNATNTNDANLYHSGTADRLKTDDSLHVAVGLGVGAAPTIADAGDVHATGGISLGTYVNPSAGDVILSGALNAGSSRSATDAGDGWFSGGVSLGTFVNPAAGDLILSHALNVGSSLSATDAGDAWISGGLSLGTFVNPAAGDLVLSHALNVGSSLSATDVGDGWISGGLSLGTFVNPAAGDLILSHALNVGATLSATDAGDAWISGGLSVGTFTNPAAGQVLATGAVASNFLAILANTSGTAPNGLYLKTAGTAATDALLYCESNSTFRLGVWNDGSVTVGAPSGGTKGAGTINCQACYDDNTLLTDHLWDLYYDGAMRPDDATRYPDARLYSIGETATFTRERRHLPTMPGRDEWIRGSKPLGSMVTHLWATVEMQQMHIFELDRRLAALERASLERAA